MASYQNKNVVVVGLGKTGVSCITFLRQKQAHVKAMDTREKLDTTELPTDVEVYLGRLNQQWLLQADLIVVSPGVSLKTTEIQKAQSKGIEIVGDIELFCREIDPMSQKVIAITGSNGKSTVTSWVYHMLQQAHFKVGIGGNIGIPVLSLLNQGLEYFVLELSSFQLESTSSLQATVATVLNVSEDHMDRYSHFEEYRQAKLSIYQHAKTVVINGDDLNTFVPNRFKSAVQKQKVFSVTATTDYAFHQGELWVNGQTYFSTDKLNLVGLHNYANALASIALAQAVDVPDSAIKQSLATFQGLAHRCQLVHEEQGIRWVNDSKATNVGSTKAALQGLNVKGNLYLLLGGDGKGADFSELKPLLNQPNIYCYCFGKDGKQLALLSEKSQYCDTMQQAIAQVRFQLKRGDMVLLSPACASYDQFANFEQRGDIFAQLAQNVLV